MMSDIYLYQTKLNRLRNLKPSLNSRIITISAQLIKHHALRITIVVIAKSATPKLLYSFLH